MVGTVIRSAGAFRPVGIPEGMPQGAEGEFEETFTPPHGVKFHLRKKAGDAHIDFSVEARSGSGPDEDLNWKFSGYMKFDGCWNAEMKSADGVMMHFCDDAGHFLDALALLQEVRIHVFGD